MKVLFIKLLFITLSLISCTSKENRKELLFEEQIYTKTGVNFVNKLTNQSDWNALNYLYFYTGAGVATGDFNNDGQEDIYFVANQEADQLYINQGNFKFKETTLESNIVNNSGWSSGVTTIDINNDGLLDIYISKLGGYKKQEASNLLYVNQGINSDSIPVFKEESSLYGLNIKGFNHQAAFLDYDLDGDLDVYLLQYSVNPKQRYVSSNARNKPDKLAGGKLYNNDNGYYVDVTQKAQIYSSAIAFGLGVAISDLNEDGYPDIYVTNDFYENDYVYINQQDGTFQEILENYPERMPHTSNFAMGNSIADVNNDGHMDIFSLDMLPENLVTRITSDPDISTSQYEAFLQKGYHPQFIRNTLQISDGSGNYSDISFQAGVAATDWSWASLFGDFDNDGFKDLFITTGIYGATNDKDFVDFMASDRFRESVKENMSLEDLKYLKELPQKQTPNYLFKNTKGETFTEMDGIWHKKQPSFSNGAVYSDLDNDGDLDLVINNVNEPAQILKNRQRDSVSHFLKIKFSGDSKNVQGIGAKVIVYTDSLKVTEENYISKGYLSAVSPTLHLGVGGNKKVDSLLVIWPDHTYERLYNVDTNQSVLLSHSDAQGVYYKEYPHKTISYTLREDGRSTTFKHKENAFNVFNQEPLIPYSFSNMGPKIAVGDINNDGLEDLIAGGGKGQATKVYFQEDNGSLVEGLQEVFLSFAQWETTALLLEDTDGDGDLDLIMGHGGQERSQIKNGGPILYFKNVKGRFTRDSKNFKGIFSTTSVIKSGDMDGDGDIDLFIGSSVVVGQYGMHPIQRLFENDGTGNFKDVTTATLRTIGMVTDAAWIPIGSESLPSLIVVGHWMAPTIFTTTSDGLTLLKEQPLKQYTGFWNSIQPVDINQDGKMDFVAGNFGTNMLWEASQNRPIRLYLNDFNKNEDYEPIVTYVHQEREVTFNSKSELTKRIPQINKKYLSYQKFANASIEDIFGKKNIAQSFKKDVKTLQSTAFINTDNTTFTPIPLPFNAQSSSIEAIHSVDINNDEYPDLLVGGNRHQFNVRLSRLDASRGSVLINNKNGHFKSLQNGIKPVYGEVRDIKKIRNANGKDSYIYAVNNDSLQLRKF